jgi:transposase-like protein
MITKIKQIARQLGVDSYLRPIYGVNRVRSTVHNWVHKVDLQPESGRCPDHVAVDETVIRLDDEQYWLYAAVDPETNELLVPQTVFINAWKN